MSAETPAAVSSDRHKARRGTEASALSRPPALPGNPPKRTSRPSQLHCSLPQSKQPPLVAITITLKGFGFFFFLSKRVGAWRGRGRGGRGVHYGCSAPSSKFVHRGTADWSDAHGAALFQAKRNII